MMMKNYTQKMLNQVQKLNRIQYDLCVAETQIAELTNKLNNLKNDKEYYESLQRINKMNNELQLNSKYDVNIKLVKIKNMIQYNEIVLGDWKYRKIEIEKRIYSMKNILKSYELFILSSK